MSSLASTMTYDSWDKSSTKLEWHGLLPKNMERWNREEMIDLEGVTQDMIDSLEAVHWEDPNMADQFVHDEEVRMDATKTNNGSRAALAYKKDRSDGTISCLYVRVNVQFKLARIQSSGQGLPSAQDQTSSTNLFQFIIYSLSNLLQMVCTPFDNVSSFSRTFRVLSFSVIGLCLFSVGVWYFHIPAVHWVSWSLATLLVLACLRVVYKLAQITNKAASNAVVAAAFSVLLAAVVAATVSSIAVQQVDRVASGGVTIGWGAYGASVGPVNYTKRSHESDFDEVADSNTTVVHHHGVIDTPVTPDILDAPDDTHTPDVPDIPDIPDASNEPHTTNAPDMPDISDAPDDPDTTDAPDMPDIPDASNDPHTTNAPDMPDIPDALDDQHTTDAPDMPDAHSFTAMEDEFDTVVNDNVLAVSTITVTPETYTDQPLNDEVIGVNDGHVTTLIHSVVPTSGGELNSSRDPFSHFVSQAFVFCFATIIGVLAFVVVKHVAGFNMSSTPAVGERTSFAAVNTVFAVLAVACSATVTGCDAVVGVSAASAAFFSAAVIYVSAASVRRARVQREGDMGEEADEIGEGADVNADVMELIENVFQENGFQN